jgi:hypothetical protein
MMRVGLYRPVHVKTLRSQKLRMLLTHRKLAPGPAKHPQSLPALPSAPRYNFKRHFGLEFNNYFRSALTLRGVSSLSIRLGNEPRVTTLLP